MEQGQTHPILVDLTDRDTRCEHGYSVEGSAICPICQPEEILMVVAGSCETCGGAKRIRQGTNGVIVPCLDCV